MGGTSTDVSHYAGELERVFDTEVAGVRLRAPMLAIHTVAAGGGSVLHFDGSRLRVGPDSAGADPGPACYRQRRPAGRHRRQRRAGPKIRRSTSRPVFGPAGDEPLDADAARDRLDALAREVGRADRQHDLDRGGGRRLRPDRGAEHGQRDQEDLGAAGPRRHRVRPHCFRRRRRAARLRRWRTRWASRRCSFHPFAGVLSAFGIGLADVRAMREQSVERGSPRLWFRTVSRCATRSVPTLRPRWPTRTCPGSHVDRRRAGVLRYEGTDTSLAVALAQPGADAHRLRAALYRRTYRS